MILEKIKTPGLAHLSYMVLSEGQAIVIDPRRDIAIYIELAHQNECQITHILETHRNEDLISGAPILAEITGADVFHGPNADEKIKYAKTVKEGHQFSFGNVIVEVLETPGHTKDSVCFMIYDQDFNQGPVGIFTGDTLFVGDVGRTDFYPDESEEIAGLLYDSLQKIKSRAPEALIYPAHGAGSVCGDGMADREFSSIQHEMKNNPLLQIKDRSEFIQRKAKEHHYIPPYFSQMERLNSHGASTINTSQGLKPVAAAQLTNLQKQGYKLIDVRSIESFLGAHIDRSFCLPVGMLTAYAGWLFEPEDKLVIIADDYKMAENAAVHLSRIGYDNCAYFCAINLAEVAAGGISFVSTNAVSAKQVKELIEEDWTLLDVRKITEYEQTRILNSEHVFLGHLAKEILNLNTNKNYITMCASGMRASVAAGFLSANGFKNVNVFWGSMGAWKTKDYPVQKG
jgi:hydroxyacylglutathione hydrolase